MKKLAWDRQSQQIDGYKRVRSDDLYHTARWTRVSRAWRVAHPLCEECRRQGKIVEAKVVDHITPWPVCEDFWNEANYQSLCERCNHEKGQRDKALIQAWKREHGERG